MTDQDIHNNKSERKDSNSSEKGYKPLNEGYTPTISEHEGEEPPPPPEGGTGESE